MSGTPHAHLKPYLASIAHIGGDATWLQATRSFVQFVLHVTQHRNSVLEGTDLLTMSAPWGRKLPAGEDCPW